jgi:hypothetical protein
MAHSVWIIIPLSTVRPLAAKISSRIKLSRERHLWSLELPVLMLGLLRRRWAQMWYKTTETPSKISNQGLTQTTREPRLPTIVAPTSQLWGMPNNNNSSNIRYSWKTLQPQSKWPEQTDGDRLIVAHWVVLTSMHNKNHSKRTLTSLKKRKAARDSHYLTWPIDKINFLALYFAVKIN